MDWQTRKKIVECNEYMLDNEVQCDVVFEVGEEKLIKKAHKYILISRSPVFFAMFCGDFQENNRVRVPDIPPEAFKQLLRFLYCEKVDLSPDNVLPVMYAAMKYIVPCLEDICRDYLSANLTVENLPTILAQSYFYNDNSLINECYDFIDKNSLNVVQSESFISLTKEVLGALLGRDTLNVEEDILIQRSVDWAAQQCIDKNMEPKNDNIRDMLGDLIYLLRFPLLTIETFAEKYSNTHLLAADDVIDIFRYYGCSDKPDIQFPTEPRRSAVESMTDMLQECQITDNDDYLAVNRGHLDNQKNTWCYDGGHEERVDGIKIMVSQPIHLVGIGLWGTSRSAARYDVDVKLVRYDLSQGSESCILLSHCHTLLQTQSKHKSPYHVKFSKEVPLNANQNYEVQVVICGEESYVGIYEPVINTDDGVRFTFSNCDRSSNGTSVDSGQIPQLLYKLTTVQMVQC